MAEIQSQKTPEQLKAYARANNLDVLNTAQISAKFQELEERIAFLE